MRINYFVWFSMTVFLMRTEPEVRVVKIEYFNPDKISNANALGGIYHLASKSLHSSVIGVIGVIRVIRVIRVLRVN